MIYAIFSQKIFFSVFTEWSNTKWLNNNTKGHLLTGQLTKHIVSSLIKGFPPKLKQFCLPYILPCAV